MAPYVDITGERDELAELMQLRSELDCSVPAAFPQADPPMPVPPYRRAFSASALKLFAECERKWFFRYICNVVEDPGSSAGTYGTAFHDALEQFHRKITQPSDYEAGDLRTQLDSCVIASFEKYRDDFDSALECELQCRRARKTAERYVTWLVERAARTPFEVVGNETHAPLELEGFEFTGYIDRLDREVANAEVTVVDYKTGSIATTANAYREEVTALREFQLPFYYWSRTAAGDKVTRLALIPLKDALLEVMPVELEIVGGYAAPSGKSRRGAIGLAELQAAKARMIDLARRMSVDTLSHFSVTKDADACTYCAYVAACRERPQAESDPFGR